MEKCNQCGERLRVKNRTICYSCKNKNYEKKHPLRVAFHRLKGHAKSRNKKFLITFEQFCEFAVQVDYISKKGRSKKSYHIDRIDEEKGYEIDNIQILTNTENVKKYLKWKQRDKNGKDQFFVYIKKEEILKDEDLPF